jgi:hypothetical protein
MPMNFRILTGKFPSEKATEEAKNFFKVQQ